jgi:hypothetical protein
LVWQGLWGWVWQLRAIHHACGLGAASVGWGLSSDGARGWVAGRKRAGWLGASRASGGVVRKN